MSEEKLVPKLRFSGFDEDWIEINIKNYSTIKGRIGWRNLKQSEYTESGPYLIAGKHITNGIINWTECDHLSMERYDESPEIALKSGDVIFSKDGSLGNPALIRELPDKATINGTMMLVRLHDKVTPNFFYQVLNSDSFLRLLYVLKSGSSIPHIFQRDMENFKFKIPQSLKEQNQISSFLEVVDEKIELLKKKYESYVNFKKYLMQQIFAQKLRFDYDDEWKTMRLNEIVFYQEGPGVRNYQYTKKGVKLLNVGNFVKNVLNLDNTDRYISEDEAYGKYNHFLVDEGDLLIACSGIKAEYFDEKIAFAEKKHLPLCMNTSTMRFKSLDENILNLKYLKCYFQTESFKKQVFSVMTGSAQFNFGPTHLKYFKIPIPSIDEQKEIYKLFGSVDDKISMINQELDKVNEFKKSLLQQMFV